MITSRVVGHRASQVGAVVGRSAVVWDVAVRCVAGSQKVGEREGGWGGSKVTAAQLKLISWVISTFGPSATLIGPFCLLTAAVTRPFPISIYYAPFCDGAWTATAPLRYQHSAMPSTVSALGLTAPSGAGRGVVGKQNHALDACGPNGPNGSRERGEPRPITCAYSPRSRGQPTCGLLIR